jgi:hypothetical protein
VHQQPFYGRLRVVLLLLAGWLQVAAPAAPQAEEEDEEMESLRARLDAVRS